MKRITLNLTVRAMLLAVACLFLFGCTSYRNVPVGPGLLRKELALGNIAKPGDRIRVQLTSGEKRVVVVEAVDDDQLRTDTGSIALRDIEAVEAKDFSETKTGVLVVGGTATVTYVLLSVLFASLAFMP